MLGQRKTANDVRHTTIKDTLNTDDSPVQERSINSVTYQKVIIFHDCAITENNRETLFTSEALEVNHG